MASTRNAPQRPVRRPWRAAGAAAAALLGVLLPSASAAEQLPASPVSTGAVLPSAVEQYAEARQRGADQANHPAFLAQADPSGAAGLDLRLLNEDPYRRGWAPARGTQVPVAFPNRYGATLRGALYAPPGEGRHPGIVLLTGGRAPELALQEFSQGLAEAGYLVLAVQAQGDAGSDAAAPDPVPSTEENEYCRPYDFGGWQQPQEMGIREQATCAGGYEPSSPPPDAATVDAVVTHYRGLAEGRVDFRSFEAYYEQVKATKTFAALDAADWLRSPVNPLRQRLAGGRLGIAGHSLGAHAAVLAGNGDPQRRFGAVVSWDGFGRLSPTASPRVPTLFFSHEIDTGLPRVRPLDPTELPAYRDAQAFHDAGVRTGVIVPDASTHQDFNFLNYPAVWPVAATLGACPECPLLLNSSRDGARVALHYTQAWFDRELKGSDGTALRVRVFPAAADSSSIGQGRYDPATQRNLPYTIGGETVADRLSPLLPSFLTGCADLRAGC